MEGWIGTRRWWAEHLANGVKRVPKVQMIKEFSRNFPGKINGTFVEIQISVYPSEIFCRPFRSISDLRYVGQRWNFRDGQWVVRWSIVTVVRVDLKRRQGDRRRGVSAASHHRYPSPLFIDASSMSPITSVYQSYATILSFLWGEFGRPRSTTGKITLHHFRFLIRPVRCFGSWTPPVAPRRIGSVRFVIFRSIRLCVWLDRRNEIGSVYTLI